MYAEFTPAVLAFIAGVFILAGFVKGVTGMGLPVVAIGLLAIRIPTLTAIAIVLLPGITTNLWQTFAGKYLKDIGRRLWPLLIFCCVGVWLGSGFLTGNYAPYGTIVLGLLLATYALVALTKVQFHISRKNEKWLGGVFGVLSGLFAATTGVQVFPAMPYIQALEMDREEFIQSLGVFFTVATVAMAINLTHAGLLTVSLAIPIAIGLAAAFAGMFAGQALRERMHPDTFRRWFLISLVVLGAYLAINKLVALHFI